MISDFGKDMLIITARRGYTGADREIFFHYLKGIRYAEMEREVLALERQGLITIEWVGPSNFMVNITPKGVETVREFESDSWNKSQKALENMHKNKKKIKSILDEGGNSSFTYREKASGNGTEGGPSDIGDENERENDFEENDNIETSTEYEYEYAGEESQGEPVPQGKESDGSNNVQDEQKEENGIKETYQKTDVKPVDERIAAGRKSRVRRRAKKKADLNEADEPTGGRIMDQEEKLQIDVEGRGGKEEEPKEDMPVLGEGYDGSISHEGENYDKVEDSDSRERGKESKQSSESSLEDLSNIDIYKQIVDAISLHKPLPDEDDASTFIVSDALKCTWEEDRTCPLKLKKGTQSELKITPEHCTVCQLVEIKKLLKNSQPSTLR